MPTLKPVIFSHHQRTDGTFNVKIRLTHNRKTAYIATTYYVTRKQLTRNFRIKDTYLLQELQILLSRYRETIVKLRGDIHKYKAKDLACYLKTDYQQGGAFSLDVAAYAKKIAGEFEAQGRKRSGSIYLSMASSLTRFFGRVDISEVNVAFLRRYEQHMAAAGMDGNVYLRTLRALFNRARMEHNDEDLGMINIPHYPFRVFRIPPVKQPSSRALGVENIINIRDSSPRTTRGQLARDVFMISFYLCGMNAVDIYGCGPSERGRITYVRKKTRSRRRDGLQSTITLPDEVTSYLEKYAGKKRLFCFADMYVDITGFNKAITKGMVELRRCDGVADGVTLYYARHSWASIARNVCGVSRDDIALALNHAGRTVTDRYIKPDFSIADRANRLVLDSLKT